MSIVTFRAKVMYNRCADRFYIYLPKRFNDVWKKVKERNTFVEITIRTFD